MKSKLLEYSPVPREYELRAFCAQWTAANTPSAFDELWITLAEGDGEFCQGLDLELKPGF